MKGLTIQEVKDSDHKCEEANCDNKAYGLDWITPSRFNFVCRKHYYEFNYGIVKGLSD